MPERHLTNLRSKAKPWKKKLAAKLSRNKSWPEKILWARLKDNQLGVPVHAQKVILGYIADFWCPKAALVVEVDGKQHRRKKDAAWDRKRDAVMRAKGISILRFTASEVNTNPAAVVAIIRDRIAKRIA